MNVRMQVVDLHAKWADIGYIPRGGGSGRRGGRRVGERGDCSAHAARADSLNESVRGACHDLINAFHA